MKDHSEHKEFQIGRTMKDAFGYFGSAIWLGFRKFLYIMKIPALIFVGLAGLVSLASITPELEIIEGTVVVIGTLALIGFIIKASTEVGFSDSLLFAEN